MSLYLIIGLSIFIISSFIIGLLWGSGELEGEEAPIYFIIAVVVSWLWVPVLFLAVLSIPVFLGKWYASRKR